LQFLVKYNFLAINFTYNLEPGKKLETSIQVSLSSLSLSLPLSLSLKILKGSQTITLLLWFPEI
jgi:hypothetical protein